MDESQSQSHSTPTDDGGVQQADYTDVLRPAGEPGQTIKTLEDIDNFFVLTRAKNTAPLYRPPPQHTRSLGIRAITRLWRVDMSDTRRIAYFNEHVIHMAKLPTMIQRLIEDLLCSKLVSQDHDYLQTRDPVLFTDHLSWISNGESFVDTPANGLTKGHLRVLESLSKLLNRHKWVHLSSEGARFSPKAVSAYTKDVTTFLELLLALVHFTSGMPARGRELTSIKPFNSWLTMRNIFAHAQQILVMTEYHKSQGLTKAPKIIPRFLPSLAGRPTDGGQPGGCSPLYQIPLHSGQSTPRRPPLGQAPLILVTTYDE
ncbi:MAG: hypothetical protein M1816_001155 [Peltula sp. TS41687]|nr:MAG: hypothetical protein M1816_001155 [Peltula sp. TS41687]